MKNIYYLSAYICLEFHLYVGLRIHHDDGFYGFIYADYGVLFWVIWIISVVLIITGLGLYLYDEIKKRQK